MKTTARAIVAVALMLGFAGHAAAQTYGTGAGIVCDKDYKSFWDRMSAQGAKDLTGQQLVEINRVAIRGYDACTSGDQRFDAKNFFDKLGGGGSKPEDVFTQSMVGQGAKK